MSYGQYSAEHRESPSNPLRYSESNGKRAKRQVYPTDEIPHLWMHQTQESARNPGGNLFFNDGVIYSYGNHFPIARHVTNGKQGKREQKAILFTTGRYSVTTSRHVNDVRMAIPSGALVFEVPDLGVSYGRQINHEENVKAYAQLVEQKVLKASRARSSYSIEYELREASEQREQCMQYCKFFGLRVPKLATVPAMDAEQLAQIRKQEKERIAKQAAEEKKHREKAYKAQIKEWMAAHPDYQKRWNGTIEHAETLAKEFGSLEDAAKIEAWLNGNGNAYNLPRDTDTLLRIVGDEVETSRGARFPIDHAKRGLLLVDAVVARGEEWKRNGHTCHLGHYQIDRIEPDGTVYAGCHVVTLQAINRIRKQLS